MGIRASRRVDYDDEALAIVASCQGRHARRALHAGAVERFWQRRRACGRCPFAFGRSFGPDSLGELARAIADRDAVAELYGLIRAQVEEGNDLLELTRDLRGACARRVCCLRCAVPVPSCLRAAPSRPRRLLPRPARWAHNSKVVRSSRASATLGKGL